MKMTTCRSSISTQGINIVRVEPDVKICFFVCDGHCWITVSPPCVSMVRWMVLSDSRLHPDGSSLPSFWLAVLGHLLFGQSCCLICDWQLTFPNSRFCSTYCPMPVVLGHLLFDQSCCLMYDWQVPFPNSWFYQHLLSILNVWPYGLWFSFQDSDPDIINAWSMRKTFIM